MFKKEGFKSTHLDAVGDIFFARQLEYVQERAYEYQYPGLKSFELIPISYETPSWAEFVTVTQYQSAGRARIINSYADDLPEASIIGAQMTAPIVSIGNSYRYSHQEIRASMGKGISLDTRLAFAARRANDQLIDDLAFYGDPVTGLTGLVNNPNVPAVPVQADGAGGLSTWDSKTPQQILRDMNMIVNQVVVNSNEVERPNTLLLPVEQYSLIASTARSNTSDTTILQFFLLNNPFIERVVPVAKLAGAGTAGVDIMIAMDSSSDKLVMHMPMAFTQYPPQERNLEFVINCESRFGGVQVIYPMSMIIGEGI